MKGGTRQIGWEAGVLVPPGVGVLGSEALVSAHLASAALLRGRGPVEGTGVLKERVVSGLGEYVFPSQRVRVTQEPVSPSCPKAERRMSSRPHTFP